MDFGDFKKLVEKTKYEHPVWFGMESDKIPSETDVMAVEGKLGVNLPKDYKDFIYEYGGGYFAFSNVYSLDTDNDWNLIDVNSQYDAIRGNYILVSENVMGDFY